MKQRASVPLQIAVFAILFGVATVLWLGRDKVTDYYLAAIGAETRTDERSRRPRIREVPVVVEPATSMSNDVTIEAIATARAKRSVTLFPEATGEIVELRVTAGERVKRGDVILRLNTQLAALEVDLARTKFAAAQKKLERAKTLRDSNVNTGAQVEDASNLAAQAKLELEQAEESLRERTLTAPFDGVVGIPGVELGDRVTPDTSIVTLDDRSALFVEVEVPEQYLSRLNLNQKVAARTPSFDDVTFEGLVAEIDSRVDPVTRAMMVRASLGNETDKLRPGMSFAIELALPGKTYPSVPELAVQWRAGESFVWVVRDNEARRLVVRSVKRISSFMLVDGDISPGDLVVVEGVQRLREGIPVKFSEPASATGES